MTGRDAALATYCRYFEGLTRATLPDIARIATPDMRFRDPFNDVRGIADVVRLLASMYAHGTPRFEVLDRALGQSAGYILWRFTNDPGGGAAPWTITGMSEIHFAADGRICEHIDHWDSGGQFYERIPVLGWLIRRVRKRLELR